jgi:hypothetical protein
MSNAAIHLRPAPVGLLPLLAVAARLPVLEDASVGTVVGVSVLAFRHGARLDTHAASLVTRSHQSGVIEPELRHNLDKGTFMKDGLLDLDGALTTVYALLRDAATLDTQQMPEWQQTTKNTADMRSVWVLQDAVLVLEKTRPQDEGLDWNAYSANRSAVFYDAGKHPSGPPASVYVAGALAQHHIAQSHARTREAMVEFADLL